MSYPRSTKQEQNLSRDSFAVRTPPSRRLRIARRPINAKTDSWETVLPETIKASAGLEMGDETRNTCLACDWRMWWTTSIRIPVNEKGGDSGQEAKWIIVFWHLVQKCWPNTSNKAIFSKTTSLLTNSIITAGFSGRGVNIRSIIIMAWWSILLLGMGTDKCIPQKPEHRMTSGSAVAESLRRPYVRHSV